MMKLTLGIIGKALFSSDIQGETRAVGEAVTGILEYFQHQVTTTIPLPPIVPTSSNRKFHAAMRKVREFVDRIIAERESRSEWPDDLLSMLMSARDQETGEGMDRRQLYDELITMIFSGYETTATALSWAWFLLSKHPEVMTRLRSELNTVLDGKPPAYEDLPNLNYTRMVIQETIRLMPPVWLGTRKAIGDDMIGGYHIPANTIVTFSPYVTHRRKDFWENPEGFDPERFLPERIGNSPRYAYFPFGGGPRQCIGNAFAMVEAQMILATVAQKYRLDLVPGHQIEPLPFGILRPRYGMPVTLRNGASG
jgi:cytochrome P450